MAKPDRRGELQQLLNDNTLTDERWLQVALDQADIKQIVVSGYLRGAWTVDRRCGTIEPGFPVERLHEELELRWGAEYRRFLLTPIYSGGYRIAGRVVDLGGDKVPAAPGFSGATSAKHDGLKERLGAALEDALVVRQTQEVLGEMEDRKVAKDEHATLGPLKIVGEVMDGVGKIMDRVAPKMGETPANPLVDILRDELKDARAEAREFRDRLFTRDTAAATAAAAPPPSNPLQQVAETLKMVKDLAPLIGLAPATTTGAPVPTWTPETIITAIGSAWGIIGPDVRELAGVLRTRWGGAAVPAAAPAAPTREAPRRPAGVVRIGTGQELLERRETGEAPREEGIASMPTRPQPTPEELEQQRKVKEYLAEQMEIAVNALKGGDWPTFQWIFDGCTFPGTQVPLAPGVDLRPGVNPLAYRAPLRHLDPRFEQLMDQLRDFLEWLAAQERTEGK